MASSPPPIKYDKTGKRKVVNEKSGTKYDGGMPGRFLDLCAVGGSPVEFCAQERIDKNTLNGYCEKYPDMAKARAMGKTLAEGWWIKQARDHLITETIRTTDEDGNSMSVAKKFDSNLYKFYVGGRFGHSGDKALRDFIDDMNRRFDSIPQATSAVAPEPEFTEDDK